MRSEAKCPERTDWPGMHEGYSPHRAGRGLVPPSGTHMAHNWHPRISNAEEAREEACGCNESRLQFWEQDAGQRFTAGVDANDEPMSWQRRTPLGPWKPATVVIVG